MSSSRTVKRNSTFYRCMLKTSVVDPDPDWIRIQWVDPDPIRNPDQDPGGQNLPTKKR
jgi:hypothetical protein